MCVGEKLNLAPLAKYSANVHTNTSQNSHCPLPYFGVRELFFKLQWSVQNGVPTNSHHMYFFQTLEYLQLNVIVITMKTIQVFEVL